MDQIYTFLKRRDISAFNPHRRPPMTEAKRRIIDESQHPLHTYIIEAVTRRTLSGMSRREVHIRQACAATRQRGLWASIEKHKGSRGCAQICRCYAGPSKRRWSQNAALPA